MIGKNKQRGIALLISVLVSSIFFVIAAAVFKIAFIEYVLSSTGKDSQFAFYSADTGAECALYWDGKYSLDLGQGDMSQSAFSVYNESTGDANGSNRNQIISSGNVFQCGGASVSNFRFGGSNEQTVFNIDRTPICAEVQVSKQNAAGGGAYGVAPEKTEILARGYNTCNTASPRRVERTLKVIIQ